MARSRALVALHILRLFGLAGERTSQQAIHGLKEISHRPGSSIISVVFERTRYIIIIDNAVGDDTEYLSEQVAAFYPEIKGHFLHNTSDHHGGYGMPYKGKDCYIFQVKAETRRLDTELKDRYTDISRATLQKYVKEGYVTVNGTVATQSSSQINTLDEIALSPPQKNDYTDQELPIVYLDDDVIVVQKPEGMLTHSKGALDDEFTVATFFKRYTTHAVTTNRPGIVHRLDRATSGIIIGARHDEAALWLKKQFADRKVQKEYIAIASGVPKTFKAIIDLPIGRNPSKPSTFRVDTRGKAAQTTYEVISSTQHLSLVRLLPKTGRTHQLRVHLQYINTPILGDPVYGIKKADRMYLHAHALTLLLPGGHEKTFTAPLPSSFTKHFKGLPSAI